MGLTLIAWLFALSIGPAPPPATPPAGPPAATKPRTGRLNLGPYGAPEGGTPKVETITDLPRFESTIDVEAQAPQDLDQAMSIWWAHFEFTAPAVYGRGTAFRQPPPNGSADFVPLAGWVADKVKDYKRDHRKAPKAQPSPEPSPSPTPSP